MAHHLWRYILYGDLSKIRRASLMMFAHVGAIFKIQNHMVICGIFLWRLFPILFDDFPALFWITGGIRRVYPINSYIIYIYIHHVPWYPFPLLFKTYASKNTVAMEAMAHLQWWFTLVIEFYRTKNNDHLSMLDAHNLPSCDFIPTQFPWQSLN